MSRVNRIIRGIRDRIPSGYLLGRTDTGDGQPHLVAITDLIKTVHDAPGGGGTQPVGANPTATASDVAVNGTATTFLRSDGAPAVQKADSTHFGLVKPDGTNLATTAGVIAFATIANLRILANVSGGVAAAVANTLTAIIDACISATQGVLLYRNGTVWTALATGNVGEVLTTGGAGANPAWTNAGTAAQILANHPGYVTGRVYVSPDTATTASLALVANTLYAVPFYCGAAHTFSALNFHVQSAAAAGKKAEVGIYNNSGGQPTTKLFDAGNVLVDATGDKTVVSSMVLPIGWYWLVIASDGTPSVFSNGTGPNNYYYGLAAIGDGISVRLTAPWIFSAGALPTNFPAISYVAGSQGPLLGLVG